MKKNSSGVGGYTQALLQAAKAAGFEKAQGGHQVICPARDCGRAFIGMDRLQDHAEAVHTFDDIRRLLSDFLREKFGKSGDYNAEPPVPGIWVWIDDLATDWVVFSKEEGNESTLLKADYSIGTDNTVTLGDPVEVIRRTVYDPVS